MNKKRVLLTSCAVILLCLTILIGMTLALFTDTKRVSNHLQAGNLAITLKRINLVKTTLNETGFLQTYPADTSTINFSDPANNDKNVFNYGAKELIVPGTKYVATMLVENNSDVAFNYWIEIKLNTANKNEDKLEIQEALAKQIKVTVDNGTPNPPSATLDKGLQIRGDNGYIGQVAIKNDQNVPYAQTFTVTVEFLDSFVDSNKIEANDNVQGYELDFDLIVHAVQATKSSTNP